MLSKTIASISVFALLCLLVPISARAEPKKDHCVILVSVDGLAGFYLDDPRADMPTLKRLAKEGARAQGLVCSFPSVTWPNHTTLVTGVVPAKHGVIGNNYLDRQKKQVVPLIPDPLFDKDEIVKVPTVYDVAHQAGLTTAGIIWPASRNAKTLDFTVPDMKGNESWPMYGTRSWLAQLRTAGIPVDHHGTWVDQAGGGVQRDWLYVRMAAHVLHNHSPNLLLIHLVETDHVQHRFGPKTDDAYWSVSYADDRLRDLVEAVQKSDMADRTTLVIASDHGFFPIDKDILPNVLFRQRGYWKGDNKAVQAVSQGGGCAVYVLDDSRRSEILENLMKDFASVEGVAQVIPSEQFESIGQPTREQDPHGADLWLAAKRGYSFVDSAAGEQIVAPRATSGGTHGYLPDQPEMHGSLVLWGAQVRGGADLGIVSNLDVAPTIAALLGVEMPTADGNVLSSAIKSSR